MGSLLCRLTKLRRLSLQSNRLSSMRGLGQCLQLRELYLSHNGIQKLEASCGPFLKASDGCVRMGRACLRARTTACSDELGPAVHSSIQKLGVS